MAKKLALDRILFSTVLLILAFGAVMVYSSSAVLSMNLHGSSSAIFTKHLISLVIGFWLMLFVSSVDFRKITTTTFVAGLLLVSIMLLIAVLFMNPLNNTYRWIRYGFFSFQPSDLAKLALIIFLARFLSRKSEEIKKSGFNVIPVLFIAIPILVLIMIEPDIGTGVTCILIMIIMLFASGLSIWYYIIGTVVASGAFYYIVVGSNYRVARMLAFLDPWADPLGYGFQPIQSMIALGSGGLFGTGLAKGTQKYFYLPTPFTDFIYSVTGEELGFVGCMVLVALFLVVLWRGMRIALRAPNDLGKYLALGLTIMIVGQAFINMSVAITLLPTKGIPLPLVSYGGTSMLINLVAVGFLLNISRYTT
jgi:cell division protein FtsW